MELAEQRRWVSPAAHGQSPANRHHHPARAGHVARPGSKPKFQPSDCTRLKSLPSPKLGHTTPFFFVLSFFSFCKHVKAIGHVDVYPQPRIEEQLPQTSHYTYGSCIYLPFSLPLPRSFVRLFATSAQYFSSTTVLASLNELFPAIAFFDADGHHDTRCPPSPLASCPMSAADRDLTHTKQTLTMARGKHTLPQGMSNHPKPQYYIPNMLTPAHRLRRGRLQGCHASVPRLAAPPARPDPRGDGQPIPQEPAPAAHPG